MKRGVSFRPEAEAETLETRDWYEGRRPGLGAEFRAALDETIERIADNRCSFDSCKEKRGAPSSTLYAVYFRVSDKKIVVMAVHGRQHPRRWQSRA